MSRGRIPHPSAEERAARGKAARSNVPGSSRSGKAFDRAIAAFAETSADQNERDHGALEEGAHAGRLAAERGV